MRKALILAALAAATAAGAAWPAARSTTPRTLLSLPTPVYAFAADGARMAWMIPDDTCGVLVRERALWGGPVATLTTPKGETCGNGSAVGPGDLVLAGSRALWTVYSASNEEDDADVTLGQPGRPDTSVGLVGWQGGIEAGDHSVPSVPMAGAGSTLAYADNGDLLSRGELYRVSGRSGRVGTVNGVRALAVDGGRIAAAVTTPAGSALTNEPAWIAGNCIGFDSFRDGNYGIYTVSASGGPWRLVRESVDERIGEPAWSRDGRRIAYIRFFNLVVMNADGTGSKIVESTREVATPSWTPDGKRIVWSNGLDGSIWATVVATSKSSRLFKVGSHDLESPVVSPAGNRVAYYDSDTNQLVVSRLDGTNRAVIGDGSDPSWSPDGSQIASSTCRITVSAPDGTGAHAITTPPAKQCDQHPSWSPDGSKIVFSRGKPDIQGDLNVVNADGTGLHRLTTTVPVPAKDEVVVVNGSGKPLAAPLLVRASRVALSGSTLVLLTRAAIVVRHLGAAAQRSILAPGLVTSMALSGRRLVFCAGGALWLADTVTGRKTRLLGTSSPVGLAISGQRLVWAESGAKTARIRALTVP